MGDYKLSASLQGHEDDVRGFSVSAPLLPSQISTPLQISPPSYARRRLDPVLRSF